MPRAGKHHGGVRGEVSLVKTTWAALHIADVAFETAKEVPAQVCQDCGEYYLDEPVAQRVYAQADAAAQRHAEVEVVQYAA